MALALSQDHHQQEVLADIPSDESEQLQYLLNLLEKHRIGGTTSSLVPVRSDLVVPDATNRERTGLSADHVHYIAEKIAAEGFQPYQVVEEGNTAATARNNTADGGSSGGFAAMPSSIRRPPPSTSGHDIPVLVQESLLHPTQHGTDSLQRWANAVSSSPEEFPNATPVRLSNEKKNRRGKSSSCSSNKNGNQSFFYCSLGNGHFTQALNLFRGRQELDDNNNNNSNGNPTPYRSIHSTTTFDSQRDAHLKHALSAGVPCLVLRDTVSPLERKHISVLLNSTHTIRWGLENGLSGKIVPLLSTPGVGGSSSATFSNGAGEAEGEGGGGGSSQFERMSKELDSYELGALVKFQVARLKGGLGGGVSASTVASSHSSGASATSSKKRKEEDATTAPRKSHL